MRISSKDLIFTLILTLVYLVLVIQLTPVFAGSLPSDLTLYSFIPATLVSTGVIYVIGIYLRSRLRVAGHPRIPVEKEVAAHVPPPPDYSQVVSPQRSPAYNPPSAPTPQRVYSAPPESGQAAVMTPQASAQAGTKFCMHCGKSMSTAFQFCPSCGKGQW